jgi:hypothetical protein
MSTATALSPEALAQDDGQKSPIGSSGEGVTSPVMNPANEVKRVTATKFLRQHGIDVDHLASSAEAIRRLNRANKDETVTKILAAWEDYLSVAGVAFAVKVDNILRALYQENTARRIAEYLSQLCDVANSFTRVLPDVFHFTDSQCEKIIAVLGDVLMFSASAFLRSIALAAASKLIYCPVFFLAFHDAKGIWLVCKSWDDDGKDREQARLFVGELIHLVHRKWALVHGGTPGSEPRTSSLSPSVSGRDMSSPNTALQGSFSNPFVPPLTADSFELKIPFCFITRLLAYIDPTDPLSKTSSKQEVRWAVGLLCLAMRISPRAVTSADGVKLLLTHAIHANSQATTREIIDAILTVYEEPTTRVYIHDEDLGALFSPFTTDPIGDPAALLQTMKSTTSILLYLLRSWGGLFWVASEGVGIKSLIDIIHLPGPVVRKMVLMQFFSSLMVAAAPHRGLAESGPWTGVEADEAKELRRELQPEHRKEAQVDGDGFDLLDGSEISSKSFSDSMLKNSSVGQGEENGEVGIPANAAVGYHVLDPFLGVLLLLLDCAGLPRALMSVIKSTNENQHQGLVPPAAAQLLQQVMVLMDTNLPQSNVRILHQCFDRVIAKLAFRNDGFVSAMTTRLFHDVTSKTPVLIPQSIVNSTQSAMSMDDTSFLTLMKESYVESDFTRWNFEHIKTLIDGPLKSNAKLRLARDRTQFFPRLLLFYRPGRSGFTAMKREEKLTAVASQVGKDLIKLLLSSKDGVDILDKSELVRELGVALQEVAEKKTDIGTPFATHDEFLDFLHKLSSTPYGLGQLGKWKIWLIIHKVFEPNIRAQDPLSAFCHRLLQNIYFGSVPNHGICSEARLTLKLALESLSNPVRLAAVTQLKRAMWNDLSLMFEWGMTRLLERLEDSFEAIVESSFMMLASITATSEEALDYLISKKPLQLLSPSFAQTMKGRKMDLRRLLYRIAGKPKGFEFLHSNHWVEEELGRWMEDYVVYVDSLDRHIASYDTVCLRKPSVAPNGRLESEGNEEAASSNRVPSPAPISVEDVVADVVPLHFLGELTRSEPGRRLVESSELWKRLIEDTLEGTTLQSRDVNTPLDTNFSISSPLAGPAPAAVPPAISPQEMPNISFTSVDINPSFSGGPGLGGGAPRVSPSSEELSDASFFGDGSPKLLILTSGGKPLGGSGLQQTTTSLSTSEEDPGDTALLSATRTVHRKTSSLEVWLTRPNLLRAVRGALIAFGNVGSSDSGFVLLESKKELLMRLILLSQYAANPTLKGTAITALTYFSRCTRGSNFLTRAGFPSLACTNAYVNKEGMLYSMSIAHPPVREGGRAEWMMFLRHNFRFTSSLYALADANSQSQPRLEPKNTSDIFDFRVFRDSSGFETKAPKALTPELLGLISNLANTFGDMAAKKARVLRAEHLVVFQDYDVMWFLLWFSAVFKLRSDARKILADCLNQRIPVQQ